MTRRVVEYETGGVVLIQRGVAIFGEEFNRLVGAVSLRILVDGDDVCVSTQKDPIVGKLPYGCQLAQGAIGRIGVSVESCR